MTIAAAVEEAELSARVRRAARQMKARGWALDELRLLADLLDSFVPDRRQVDVVGNVAWLADRRQGVTP